MPVGQNWTIAEDGGHFANPKLSRKLRYANTYRYVFRQFVRKEPGYGKGAGETIDYPKVTMAQTKGGKIGEFQDIPETKFVVRRGSLSVTEWGNSIPWTGKLETLSEFDPENPVQKAILNDQKQVLDEEVATQMKTAELIYIPTGETAGTWDTDGVPSTSALANFNYFHLKQIVDAASTGEFGATVGTPIPPMPDGNYVLILSVRAARGLLDDPEYQEAAKFAYPRQLFNGELNEVVYNCRVVVTNNRNALSNGVGTNSVLGEAILIGDDSIVEGVALEEELRYKLAVKYGRDKGLAWYSILGFAKPWSLATDNEEHIIRIGSS